jgi:pimeloyl-ACP methyl ester carboxylesterase
MTMSADTGQQLAERAALPVATESRVLDLPGLRMHVVTAGPAHGPLVILLHGFPEYWYSWRRQIGPLAEAGFHVVAPDQRGYNLTGQAGPYDLATTAGDALRLMDAFGQRQAHWVGHDWGGAVAWTVAEQYPSAVESLTICNVPHPLVGVRSVLRGNVRQAARSAYIYFFQLPGLPEWLLARNDYRLMRQGLRATSNQGTFTDLDLDRYARAWAQPGALRAMLGWYRSFMRGGLLRLGRMPPVRRIAARTLLVWGERDPALGVELAVESARLLERGRLVRLPEATHWVHQDQPDEVNRLMLDHLRHTAYTSV